MSGMALGAHAPNKDAALDLIRFLAGADAQQMYAEVNGEYPLREGTAWSEILNNLGQFKTEELSLQAISDKRADALLMTDRVGYNR